MILYSVQGRTGVNISPLVVGKLCNHENIVGIKEASGNISQVVEIANYVSDTFTLYSGNADTIVPLKAAVKMMGKIEQEYRLPLCDPAPVSITLIERELKAYGVIQGGASMIIIIHGCNGRMGKVLATTAAKESDIEIICGIEQNKEQSDSKSGFPIYQSLGCHELKTDVIIDFSHPSAL